MDNRQLQADDAPLGASHRPVVAGSIRALILTIFTAVLAAGITWLETGGASFVDDKWAVYIPLLVLVGRAIEGAIDEQSVKS